MIYTGSFLGDPCRPQGWRLRGRASDHRGPGRSLRAGRSDRTPKNQGPTKHMVQLAILGMQEWWPILIIVVLLFGARKLPDLARSLGSSVNEFKKGMSDGVKDDKSTTEVKSAVKPSNGKDH